MDQRHVALAALVALAGCGPSRGGSSSGAVAASVLSDTEHRTLVAQVDHAAGLEPSPRALALLEARLRAHTAKLDVRVVRGRVLADARRPVWSLADLRALEARNAVTAEGALVLHVVYVEGASDRDAPGAPLLGCSISARSFAVFPAAFELDPANASDEALEGAVLVHEAGHLLGLVGLCAEEVTPHESSSRPNHCATEGCIMQAESTRWDFAKVDFCAACVADLRAHGGR